MEIINKRHREVYTDTRLYLESYLRVDKKVFYFSAACNVKLGIMPGLFMHFINDDDRWMFYLNSEDDGFPTLAREGKNSCLVMNVALSNIFFKRTNCSEGTKFPVVMTEAKIKNSPIYEILLNKPFD